MKPIHTYQSLGRTILEIVYRKLNGHVGMYGACPLFYDYLTFHVQRECADSIFVDPSFAMHKYNHGKSESAYSCTYRWENVMNFYIRQQIAAGLLARTDDNKIQETVKGLQAYEQFFGDCDKMMAHARNIITRQKQHKIKYYAR